MGSRGGGGGVSHPDAGVSDHRLHTLKLNPVSMQIFLTHFLSQLVTAGVTSIFDDDPPQAPDSRREDGQYSAPTPIEKPPSHQVALSEPEVVAQVNKKRKSACLASKPRIVGLPGTRPHRCTPATAVFHRWHIMITVEVRFTGLRASHRIALHLPHLGSL